MNKIKIKNVGPIAELDLCLDRNINLIIGPLASGKSTLGKIIYFCKKIRDYYIDFLLQESNFTKSHRNDIYINFLKYIRKNYMGCFGTTKHMRPFFITYFYDDNSKVDISLEKGYAKLKFSNELEALLKDSFNSAYDIYHENLYPSNSNSSISFADRLNLKAEIKLHFSQLATQFFCSDEDILYIPAGRGLLSVLSDQIDIIDLTTLDLPMKEFMERIRITKSRFGTKLDSVVADYLKTEHGQIKNTDLSIAKDLIKQILKAEYVSDADSEKLYFDEAHWVKLNYGSSGQQESLWILLLLFIIILENKKTYIIIEEPEAHLYPVAQKHMIELIALTANSSNSNVLVTTHSPYILSSTNLLIQSAIVENSAKVISGKELPVILKQLRISPSKINAYKISEQNSFQFTSIIDKKSGMIDSFAIDTISEIINSETELLFDMEIKYDL